MPVSVDNSEVPAGTEGVPCVGGAVKDTLEGAMGLLLTPVQWSQASLPTTNVTSGGVGLRMTSKHSVAAYMKLNESHG